MSWWATLVEICGRPQSGPAACWPFAGRPQRVCARNPAPRGLVLVGDRDQRLGELGGVAGLLAVPPFPRGNALLRALRVVVDRQLGPGARFGVEKLGAEETG